MRFLIFLAMIFYILPIHSQNCNPQTVHINLGDYYYYDDPVLNSPMLIIGFQTFNKCFNVFTLKIWQHEKKNADYVFKEIHPQIAYELGIIAEDFQYEHFFKISGLDLDSFYNYSILAFNKSENGPMTFFLPNLKSSFFSSDINYYIFGDIEQNDLSFPFVSLNQQLKTENKSMVFQIGGFDTLPMLQNDFLTSQMNETLAQNPYFVLPGFSNNSELFRQPLYEQTKNDYYSLNVGEVHFVLINVRNPLSNAKTILDWLDKDLSNFQRLNRWTIVLLNKPIYLILNDFPPYELEFFRNLQQKLKDHNVDLVITTGGNHYQRTMPLNNQEVFPFKTLASNHSLISCKNNNDCSNFLMIHPDAPVYISESFNQSIVGQNDTCSEFGINCTLAKTETIGFAKISFCNQTHLYFEQISLENKVLDSFYLVETQNIGVLEPVPINRGQEQEGHSTLLIVFLVFCLLTLLGVGGYFIHKKIRSHMEKTLINYEMERL